MAGTVQAKWNSKKWKMNSSKINPISAASYGMSYDSDEKTKEKRSITIPYEIHIGLGIKSIRTEINSWYKLLGQTGPIYFGTKRFGPKKSKLIDVSVSNIELAKDGTIISASLSLKFEEARKEKKKDDKGGKKNAGKK